jgi:hypothetical protein
MCIQSSRPYFNLNVLKENDSQINRLSSSSSTTTKYKCHITSHRYNMLQEGAITNPCFTFYCHIALLTLTRPMEASHYLCVKHNYRGTEKTQEHNDMNIQYTDIFNGYYFSVFNSVVKMQTVKSSLKHKHLKVSWHVQFL